MSVISGVTSTVGQIATHNPIADVVKGAASDVAGLGLKAISSWVLDGTKSALQEVARVIGAATTPNLESTWFSSTYWRVTALAGLLTVPFLCAAAVQALVRSDLALLAKAAFGYLPLSAIGVSLAGPLTTLLLAATDQMSKVVSATAVNGGPHFLKQAATAAGSLSAVDGSPFFAVIVGLVAVMAALTLSLELIIRSAAVYVVVLMLPLAFAAMVWPARRIWAVRLVELLVSLILSKFVIVAVLSLAGAALEAYSTDTSQLLTAMALLMLATFSPWALMRLLPFTEVAAGAGGMLRQELPSVSTPVPGRSSAAAAGAESAASLPARMRQQSDDLEGAAPDAATAPSRSAIDLSLGRSDQARSGEFPAAEPAAPTGDTEVTQGEQSAPATATTQSTAESSGKRERLPDMDPIWQAQNGEWGEIKQLGPDFVANGIDYSPATESAEAEDRA